jgi:hypothetical protein
MIIDSSGRVGIGVTSPRKALDVRTASSGGSNYAVAGMTLENDTNTVMQVMGGASGQLGFTFTSPTVTEAGYIYYNNGNNYMQFGVNGSERARIDSSGNLLVGKTNDLFATSGTYLGASGVVEMTTDGSPPLRINRKTSDGEIIRLAKDGSTVGSIGVDSGSNATAMFIGSNDTGLEFGARRDNVIAPFNPITNIYRDDAISLGGSTERFKDLYLSGGVYLGGTGSANKLDDYETGTWTPSTTSGTVTFSSANYVKVGDVVTVYINNIQFSNTTTSQTLRIDNLPFTSSGDSVGSVMASNVNPTSGFDCAYVGNGTSRIEFFANNTGGFSATNRNTLSTGNSLYIQVTYKAV